MLVDKVFWALPVRMRLPVQNFFMMIEWKEGVIPPKKVRADVDNDKLYAASPHSDLD